MNRHWKFPPSRFFDALLVLFVLNGALVVWSIVARHATADDPVPQQTSSAGESDQPTRNDATIDLPADKAVTAADVVPERAEIESNSLPDVTEPPTSFPTLDVPSLEVEYAPTPTLEQLRDDPNFQQFQRLAEEQLPGLTIPTHSTAETTSYVDNNALPTTNLSASLTEPSSIAEEPVAADRLRDLEERLLVVSDLNQAALRLARIAHRHAAASRADECQQALQLSQQLRSMATQLLSQED